MNLLTYFDLILFIISFCFDNLRLAKHYFTLLCINGKFMSDTIEHNKHNILTDKINPIRFNVVSLVRDEICFWYLKLFRNRFRQQTSDKNCKIAKCTFS